MTKIAHELQGIRTIYTKEIKAQKQSFKAKLERVIKRLELPKTRSKIFKEEIRALKSPNPMQKKRPAQSIPATKKVSLETTSLPASTNLSVKYLVKKHNYTSIANSKPI